MDTVRQIIDWMKVFLNSDVGMVFSFISLIVWMFSSTMAILKFIKTNLHSILGIGLLILIVLFGLVFPILVLLSSPWTGWGHILLNILAIYGVFSFFGLLYIMRSMNKIIMEPLQRKRKKSD